MFTYYFVYIVISLHVFISVSMFIYYLFYIVIPLHVCLCLYVNFASILICLHVILFARNLVYMLHCLHIILFGLWWKQ
jgi:hypothetical protein